MQVTPKCLFDKYRHCDDRIAVNCDKNILSSKGANIFYHLAEFAEENGDIPVFLLCSEHVIVKITFNL